MVLLRSLPLILLTLLATAADARELVVYSSQKEPYIKPLLDRYTRETGTPVAFLNDQGPVLVERLAAEGAGTRADVLLTVDAGNLWQAAERGLLAAVASPRLAAQVPAQWRDPEGRWFGISQRARTIVYSRARVRPTELSGYAALADARWKGRLCLRSSQSVYNQSLVAALIARDGAEAVARMLAGWVGNLAARPLADDTLVLRAIAGGECDVGITNMYYLARLLREDEGFPVAVHWADQDGAGVHVNLAGAGVVAASDDRAGAQALIEWLTSTPVQNELARMNLEYPVNPKARPDPLLAAWGDFKPDAGDVTALGRLQAEAVKAMDRAGWR